MRKIISIVLSFGLLFQQSGLVYAVGELNLVNYLSQARSAIVQSDRFRPAQLRYISYDIKSNDFKLLLDRGIPSSPTPKLDDATQELFNYFLIGLALPNDTFWVNLRPDAPDNIIDPLLEKTDIGRIFLEADLCLKKDTAILTSPRNPEGRIYWDKLYKKAGALFGTENITIPTITRPWIVPNEVIVRETEDSAYIYKATLKVMLEADYLIGRGGSRTAPTPDQYTFSDPRLKELNEYSTQLIRETILPRLTKEVNSSKRYAKLRQVYYSLVLARWFKQKYQGWFSKDGMVLSERDGSFYEITNIQEPSPQNNRSGKITVPRIDSGDLTNLTSQQPCDKQAYFQAYQKSFKDGEYNLQETVATPFGQNIRSYISGGLGFGFKYKAVNSPVAGLKVNSSPVTDALIGQPPATTSPLMTKEEFLSKINLMQEEVLRSLGKGNDDYYYDGGIYENDTYVISKVWRRTGERFPEKIKFRRIDGGNIIEIYAIFLSPDLFYSYIMPAIDTILPGIEYPLWRQALAISIKYDDYKNLTLEAVLKFNQRDYAKVIDSAHNKILPVNTAMRNGPEQEALTIKEMQTEMKAVLRALLVNDRAGEYFLQIEKLLTMLRVVKERKADMDKLFSSKPPQEEYSDLYILNDVFERLKEFVFKDGKRIHDDIKAISVAEAIQEVFAAYCKDIVLKLQDDSLLGRAQKDNLRSIEENKITADKAGELIKIIDWLLEKEREGATPIFQNYRDNLLFIQEVTSPRAAGSPLSAEEFIRAVKVIESAAGRDKQISYEDAFHKIIALVPLIKEGERIPSEWITDTLFYIIHNGAIRDIYDKSFLEMAIGRRKYTRDSFLNMVVRQLQKSKSYQEELIKDDMMSAISGLAVMLGKDFSKYEKEIEYIGNGNDYYDYLKKLNKIGIEVLNTIENPLGRKEFNASLVSAKERLSIIIKYNSFLSATDKARKIISAGSPLTGVSSAIDAQEAVPVVLKRGGIDLTDRMLKINLERVGSFALSSLALPEITNVEALDLDKEYERIQSMVSSSIRPSDARILEFAAACYYREEFDQRLAQVSSCIKAAHISDELLGKDSSPELRLATMLPDVLYGG